MRKIISGLTLAAALLLAACGGGGGSLGSSSSSGGGTNQRPTANAGAAQTVASGAVVTLNGSGTDSDGSIASYAWTQTAGAAVTLSSTTAAGPTFTAPTVGAATVFTFRLIVTDNRGLASTASTVNITVNAPVVGNVTITGRVRYARPLFATTFPFGLNYASPSLLPSRGVIVRAMNGGTEITRSVTEDDGDYSLTVPGSTSITIQVIARLLRDNTQPLPRWDVRVQDGTAGNNPYTHSTAAFNSGAGITQNIDIPTNINAAGTATGTRASGPFAALDTIYESMQLVLTGAPTANFPALIVDWGTQTDGTFFDTTPPQRIALLADLTEDTDEYDQHVVAHEFGHYIEANFSRADNIGGAHGLGDRLDIRVAFGEGFGYAFAAMVHDDPNARDSFVNGATLVSGGFNIETNPTTPATGNDDVGCWCSESSVWAILYDLYDTNPDGVDTLSLGFAPIWNVLVGNQRTTPAFTSIFSFISALKTARPADAAAINSLVAPQNIDTIADAFGTGETHTSAGIPAAAQLPLYTTITAGGGPVNLESSDNAGLYNTLGNHRFLRFTATSGGQVTVRVTTSNSDPNSDPDFRVWRAGTLVLNAESSTAQVEEDDFTAVNGTTYVLDVYDCANGCGGQGTPGDYVLTVTIN